MGGSGGSRSRAEPHESPVAARDVAPRLMDPREVLELVARTTTAEDEAERLVHLRRLPARRPREEPLPDDLAEVLRGRLELLGVRGLYAHQAAAIALARSGQHVVVATGTASGKSLAYQLPVAERLVADDRATALYLSPTKALARDQLRALREWRLPQIRAATLDGDTPRTERDAIRRTANVVLTNPDLLHVSVLPDHARWADFLHRLAFVVVDECHVARGVFGSHVALVLRRLRRLAGRYAAEPTFVLASATIGNPGEHATTLTGLPVTAVVEDGSPRGALDVGLWQPPLVDDVEGTRRSAVGEAGEVLAAFVGASVQTLVFTTSRRAAEVVAMVARDRLGDSPLADAVASYRAGYLPEERRELERRLVDGDILGLAATSALELGIDVGGLDAVILAGYPGTVASFWQRVGRAGRAGGAATGVLVAGDDPLDQYLVSHPGDLLDRAPEDAIVDPANPYILGPHLRCACQEEPLADEDSGRWFGDGAGELLAADVEAGILRSRGGRFFWLGRRRAAMEVDLRSAGGEPFVIVDIETGALVGDVDESRAYRQVHPGAVYVHQGRHHVVEQLDVGGRVATVRENPTVAYTTRARATTDVSVLEVLERRTRTRTEVGLARVEVTDRVTGYDVLDRTHRCLLDRVDLDLPETRLRTVAVWWTLPPDALTDAGIPPTRVPGSLHAAEHAAIGLLPLIALCDRWDIGGLSTALHPDTGLPTIFVYDGYAGGAGLAERSFRRLEEHLRATRDAITGCGCRSGCPSCVQSPKCGTGNEPLDKDGAIAVLDLVLA
ncbi:MAG: DEAD/DEAH box helicase [Nitriliruptorales bacterium]